MTGHSLGRWWHRLTDAETAGGLSAPQAAQILALVGFLRAGETQQVFAPGTLARLAAALQPARRLAEHCAALDERFGGGLFRLALPEKDAPPTESAWEPLARVMADVIGEMACAPSAAFAAPGAWHERMLALSEGRRARRSGVVFTPEYVAQYLARQTLEPHRRPSESGVPLRIIDPACGGGALAVAAFRCLLAQGWPLSDPRAEIHGVDVDPRAVLATRRALWLEQVSAGAPPTRPLGDDLAAKIRCGDLLLDNDFHALDGTFDAVIGNPPYRRELASKDLFDRLAASDLGRRFRTARMDLAYYFIYRGLELLAPGGRLAYIVPSYWTAGRSARQLIAAFRDGYHIEEIFLLDRLRVFRNVAGRHMLLTAVRQPEIGPTTVKRAPGDSSDPRGVIEGRIAVPAYVKRPDQLFRAGGLDLEPPCEALLEKIERAAPLASLGEIRQGIVENPACVTAAMLARHAGRWRPGEGVFALTPGELESLAISEHEQRLVRPYHDLRDLGRYRLAAVPSLRLIYSTAETWPELNAFPALRDHLQRFRPILDARRETRLGRRPWWQLHWPREDRLWQSPKLLVLQMAARPSVVAALGPVYVPFSANVFVPRAAVGEHLNYLAAVLNSRVLWKWFRHRAKRRGVGLEINGHVLAQAPLRRIDFAAAADRARHGELAALAAAMLGPCAAAERVDRRIDDLVAELYGLTDRERESLAELGFNSD